MSGGGLEMEIEPERSPEFAAAREKAITALQELRRAAQAMEDEVDTVAAHHDDVVELIQVCQLAQELAETLKLEIKGEGGIVLTWLLRNVGGVREVRCGDIKFWGEKDKSTHCNDVGLAGLALAQIRLGPHLEEVAAVGVREGGLEGPGLIGATLKFWGATRGLFREVVSANGLKEGACRKILAADAEARVRAEFERNPAQPLEGEEPEAAVERVLEVACEAAYLEHFEEVWPDKVKGGDPKTRLGVGNMRFLYRRGGGSKKDFEELERRRLAAGGDA